MPSPSRLHSQLATATAPRPIRPPLSLTVAWVTQSGVPLYLEYTGAADAVKTVELRARVLRFLEQASFTAGTEPRKAICPS